jgi:hypothetical protein
MFSGLCLNQTQGVYGTRPNWGKNRGGDVHDTAEAVVVSATVAENPLAGCHERITADWTRGGAGAGEGEEEPCTARSGAMPRRL